MLFQACLKNYLILSLATFAGLLKELKNRKGIEREEWALSFLIFLFTDASTVFCIYNCASKGDVENNSLGCEPVDGDYLESSGLSSGTNCLCNSGDECNKVPCTDEGIQRAGETAEKKDGGNADGGGETVHGSWLCLITILATPCRLPKFH